MVMFALASEAATTTPVSPTATVELETARLWSTMPEAVMRTVPTSGMLTERSMSGTVRGVSVSTARDTSRSLAKSRPDWEMTAEMCGVAASAEGAAVVSRSTKARMRRWRRGAPMAPVARAEKAGLLGLGRRWSGVREKKTCVAVGPSWRRAPHGFERSSGE
jgi:hypothetical protein